MADFRRLVFALASAAFLTGLAASASAQTLQCDQLTGTIQDVRKEGITERIGDIVLSCGYVSGTTQNGAQVPPATIRVQVKGTRLTSRIVAPAPSGGIQAGPFVESLLMIDDPGSVGNPNPQLVCAASGTTESPSGSGVCTIISDGNPDDTYNGTTTGGGHPNIFQGHQSLTYPDTVEFPGVPLDPPGSNKRRIIRITNIRIDVGDAAWGDGDYISANIDVQGSASVNVLKQDVVIARVRKPGLVASTKPDATFMRCINQSEEDYQKQGQAIIIREGFQSAWLPKNATQVGGGAIGDPDTSQNIPGFHVFSESGFENVAFPQVHGVNVSGVADGGTRIYLLVSAPPANVLVTFPSFVPLTGGSVGGAGLVLIQGYSGTGTGWNHANNWPFNKIAATATTSASANISLTPGADTVLVYEVQNSDPNNIETATIKPLVTYLSTNLTDASVNTWTIVKNVSFAPNFNYTQPNPPTGYPNSGSDSDGIPRFVRNPDVNLNLLEIGNCTCSLLFPWVVSDGTNYITALEVSNTSMDPTNTANTPIATGGYSAVAQGGPVTFYLFGNGTSSPQDVRTQTPSPVQECSTDYGVKSKVTTTGPCVPSAAVNAGMFQTFLVPNNFAGYAIANAQFQYCHGIAFLYPLNSQAPTMSYLGLVMDGVTGTTTGSQYGNFFDSGVNNNTNIINLIFGAADLQRTTQRFRDSLGN